MPVKINTCEDDNDGFKEYRAKRKKEWVDLCIASGFTEKQAEFLFDNCRLTMVNTMFPSLF